MICCVDHHLAPTNWQSCNCVIRVESLVVTVECVCVWCMMCTLFVLCAPCEKELGMGWAELGKRSAHPRLGLCAQGQRQGVWERDCSLTGIFKGFVGPQPSFESPGWAGRRGAALASAFPAIHP